MEYVFPGCRTKDLSIINKPMFERVCKKVISLFNNAEHDYMQWAITTSFQSVSAEFGRGVIHADQNTVFAAVLYLTPDAPLNAGTSLFKPNRHFDEVVRINNVYNTLILYEGRHYHAANAFFGKTLQDSRLAQVFFVSKIDAQKYSSFPVWRSQQVEM